MSKRISQINDELSLLKKPDVSSLVLFTLYKLRDTPDYLTLSELPYIIEGTQFSKFLSYYGGMTLKIPTVNEFRLIVQALTLYQYVNIEHKDFKESLDEIRTADYSPEELKEAYLQVTDALSNYEFIHTTEH